MGSDAAPDSDSDLDAILKARKERQRRSAARRSAIVFTVGCLVLLAGAGLWIGNRTGEFVTFPLAGYITLMFGGFLCWVSRQTWKDIRP